jgi:putative aldouronate transport system substrate-binding protein
VQTVISQYVPSINSGAIDPAKILPEFLSALEVAGINEIIAENQRQLDAWASGK